MDTKQRRTLIKTLFKDYLDTMDDYILARDEFLADLNDVMKPYEKQIVFISADKVRELKDCITEMLK